MAKTGLSPNFYRRRQAKGFTGYTLLEIMVSVSLMLIIMYAVAAIFGRVGTIINETQSTMVMANNLRNVCKRLQTDLKQVSVPLAPPRNSKNNEGYFCYIEGLGTSFTRIRDIDLNASSTIPGNFSSDDIAWDSDRSKGTIAVDTTVGDMDDILMFTAKAPAGEYFRGRFLEPIYDGAGNIIGCQEVMKESEYAEIIWFLRGTTLYRRTLLILPQEELQKGLDALAVQLAKSDANGGNAVERAKLVPIYQQIGAATPARNVSAVELGYGFFRYFDVSVHLDYYDNDSTYLSGMTAAPANRIKRVVANTLGDLSNRKNRYGYWSSVCGSNITSMHGNNGAWYWLRLPTLQESATIFHRTTANTVNYLNSFRAGEPFGFDNSYTSGWAGWNQVLTADGSRARTEVGGMSAANLPIMPVLNGSTYTTYPFIDFWNAANCWQQVNFDSGDLVYSMENAEQIFDQDVMMANVLSFDVKAWDEDTNQYVGLGSKFQTGKGFVLNGINGKNVFDHFKHDFKSIGEYKPYRYDGNNTVADYINLTFLPAVYDTWTEQYQVEYAQRWEDDYMRLKNETATYNNEQKEIMRSTREEMLKMTTGGEISSSRLIDFPPPYDLPLKAVQIEIRVFDPRSRNIRNMTIPVEFTTW